MNSNLAPLLEDIQAEDYEEATVFRYLNDFAHMVYKPLVSQEHQVG